MAGVTQIPTRLATAAALISLLTAVAMTAGAQGVASSGSLPAPITAPAGTVLTMPFPHYHPVAVADQVVYYTPPPTYPSWRSDRLFYAEVTSGTRHRVALALAKGEVIEEVATDGQTLVVLVWRRAYPVPPPTDVGCDQSARDPLTWRLFAAPLAHGLVAGSFRVLDAGRNVLEFQEPGQRFGCGVTRIPPLAVAAGRVAYAIEHVTAAQPAGSRILVRSLASGAVVRSVTRPRQVWLLALSATTIAWSEAYPETYTGVGWWVRRASMSGGASTGVTVQARLGRFPQTIALDDRAVVVSLRNWENRTEVVERIASNGSATWLDPPGASECWIQGSSGTTIAMRCRFPGGKADVFMLGRNGEGVHPLLGLWDAEVGPTSIAWVREGGGPLSVVRLADLRWP